MAEQGDEQASPETGTAPAATVTAAKGVAPSAPLSPETTKKKARRQKRVD